MSLAAPAVSDLTAVELAARVGDIPLWRIRLDPPPGAATEEDVERIRREEGAICELINGVLVEKAVSDKTAFLGIQIATLLSNFITPRRIGWILGADGFVWLFGELLRAPDVSFARRDQRPDGRPLDVGYSDTAPALAVAVFSPGITAGEMQRKRAEFFAAGTELFWIVYPDREEVEVWTGPETHRTLRGKDVLDGGTVLPGFEVKVADIFANLDLGPRGDER
jgi:Uma2 family endonuclease